MTYIAKLDTLEQVFDDITREILFSHGRFLYGIHLDIRGDACRIILKTYTKGKPEIAFINASSFDRCLEVLTAFNHTKADTGVKWRQDNYFKPQP